MRVFYNLLFSLLFAPVSLISQDNCTIDDQPPVPSCSDDITVMIAEGETEATVNYTVPGAVDNCPGGVKIELVEGIQNGGIFPLGVTTVTYRFTDANDNTTTCSFDVTVESGTAPIITCPENITVKAEQGKCGATVDYKLPTAIDNLQVELKDGLGPGAFFPVGTTVETYSATDNEGVNHSCSFTITVEDTEPPRISCPDNIEIKNEPNKCGAVVTYKFPIAADNCNDLKVELTSGLGSGSFFPVGTTTEVYTATDNAGNSLSCQFNITVKDVEPPVIELKKKVTTKWPPNHKPFTISVENYIKSVTDNCPETSVDHVVIEKVSSDEEKNGTGDGNTTNDIVISDDCRSVQLLAERKGNSNGRVYTVHFAVSDVNGNVTKAKIKAKIAHDQGKNSNAVDDGPKYTVRGCEPSSERVQHLGPENSENDFQSDINPYPNPFNNTLGVNYTANVDDKVSLDLYSLTGARVKNLFDGDLKAKRTYTWRFDVHEIEKQIYILVIQGRKTHAVRKVIKN